MKNLFAIIALCFIAQYTHGEIRTSTGYTVGSDEYLEYCSDIPTVRHINGGMVFKIEYIGSEWDNEKKGAFEHACKIWEENIPHCPPLRIRAEFGTIRSIAGTAPLSKVVMRKLVDFGGAEYDFVTPQSHMKAIVIREYENGFHRRFAHNLKSQLDLDNPASPDIHIVFNRNKISEFSFSLDASPTNKYDFVTLALREIARGLGFNCSIRNNPLSPKEFIAEQDSLTPYENIIRWSMLGETSEQTYQKATSGSLRIALESNSKTMSELYAPAQWQNSYSLNYFIPDSTYKITQLLTYNFGKGTVIRDISDPKYPSMFRYLFNWFADYPSGIETSGTNHNGTSAIIPYNGEITLNDLGISTPSYQANSDSHTVPMFSDVPGGNAIVDSCYRKYHPGFDGLYDGFISGRSISISILKKDGSWDYIGGSTLDWLEHGYNIKLSDMEFHYPDSVYATTADGHLRARMTIGYGDYPKMSWRAYYYAMNYHPQSVEVKYGKILRKGEEMGMDANLREIKVTMKNLEGAERILVEQMEEGHRVPTRFEVADFKKGYFTAIVDKDKNTSFTVISYNRYGGKRGNTISVKPFEALIEKPDPFPGIIAGTTTLSLVDSNGSTIETDGIATYSISPLSNLTTTPLSEGSINRNKAVIDISSIPSGLYVLNYSDNRISQSFKFKKK